MTSGRYDIAVNNITYNEKRVENYLFSYPYAKTQYLFYTSSNANPITSFADAAGKTIEFPAGTSVATAIEKWNELNPNAVVDIQYAGSDAAVMMQRVADGIIDFGITDVVMYDSFQAEYNFAIQSAEMPDDEAGLIANNLHSYFLFSKEDTQLREEVNAVLKEMQADGTIARIGQEQLGHDFTPAADQYETPLN